jgi:hypothetical protein
MMPQRERIHKYVFRVAEGEVEDRVTRKMNKYSPNIWKFSQNWSQNIKAQIEGPYIYTQLLLTLK